MQTLLKYNHKHICQTKQRKENMIQKILYWINYRRLIIDKEQNKSEHQNKATATTNAKNKDNSTTTYVQTLTFPNEYV